MQFSKRHSEILRILREEGTSTIIELSQRLSVSLETIRRDVRPLADSGEILKMHGAVALPYQLGEAPFEKRMRENAEAKRAIARQAASHIHDGDSVMLDTGTTTSLLARELLKKRGLTIVTNSYEVWKRSALELQGRVDAFVVLNHNTLKDADGRSVDQLEAGAWYLRNIGIPGVGHEKQFVEEGILCAVDDSGYKQGFEAVRIAKQIGRAHV